MTPLEEITTAVARYRMALDSEPLYADAARADLERLSQSALMAVAVADLSAKLDGLTDAVVDLNTRYSSHWHRMYNSVETGGPSSD